MDQTPSPRADPPGATPPPAPDGMSLPCDFGSQSCLSQSGIHFQQAGDGSSHWIKTDPPAEGAPAPSGAPFHPTARKYVISGSLDKGGMGAVYRAFDRDIRREVALKLPGDEDPRSRLRLIEEAQVTGQLEHPNIVPVHELGVNPNGGIFFTMKLVEGRSLKEILARVKSHGGWEGQSEYRLSGILAAYMGVCHAVAFAHSRGVIHRDLKPANIMIGAFGEVQVMDWGLAKASKAAERFDARDITRRVDVDAVAESSDVRTRTTVESLRSSSSIELTLDGMVVGTPAYMAPEQAEGRTEAVDEQSDVYALGAMLYEILTLERPIDGKDFNELLAHIIGGVITPPHIRVPSVARELSAIAMKALAAKKEFRYGTVLALQHDVQLFLEGRSVSAKDDSAWETLVKLVKRNKIAGGAAAIIAVVLVVALVVNIFERRNTVRAFSEYRAEQKARVALIARDYYERQRQWIKVFEDDFSDASVLDRWQVIYGHFGPKPDGTSGFLIEPPRMEVIDGELRISGGAPQALMPRQPVRGDCAMEFDCHLESDYLNDVSCFMQAIDSVSPVEQTPYSGYLFQLGGYDNSRVICRRAGAQNLYQEFAAPLERGKRFHVRAERIADRCIFIVNGDTIIDVRDPEPLYGLNRSTVGIYGWLATAYYDNVKVYRMGASLKDDLMQVADRHLKQGDYRTARDLFVDVAHLSVDESRRRDALEQLTKAERLMGINDSLPVYRARLARQRWLGGPPTLEICEDGLVLDLVQRGDSLRSLDILKGMLLARLNITNCRALRSIDALRDMPLRELKMWGQQNLRSMEPIATLPLTMLCIENTASTSLECVRGRPLVELFAAWNSLSSLEPLRGMRLSVLELDGNNISDIRAVSGMPLWQLMLDFNDIADVSPVHSCASLRLLHLRNSRRLVDISSLAGLDLRVLAFDRTGVSDISALAGMKLIKLSLNRAPIVDITALRGMPLQQLDLDYTRVTDLSPLAGMRLRSLGISGLSVKDLSVIAGMPLIRLDAYGVALGAEACSTIARLPLGRLSVDVTTTTGLMLARRMSRVSRINGIDREYVMRFADALDSGGTDAAIAARLRAMSRTMGDRRYLLAPVQTTFDSAQLFCARFGAVLAVPGSVRLLDSLHRYAEPIVERAVVVLTGVTDDMFSGAWAAQPSVLPRGPLIPFASIPERNRARVTRLTYLDAGGHSFNASFSGDHGCFVMQWPTR